MCSQQWRFCSPHPLIPWLECVSCTTPWPHATPSAQPLSNTNVPVLSCLLLGYRLYLVFSANSLVSTANQRMISLFVGHPFPKGRFTFELQIAFLLFLSLFPYDSFSAVSASKSAFHHILFLQHLDGKYRHSKWEFVFA